MISILKFKNIKELVRVFSDDKICHQYLAQNRWNTGVIDCPYCAHEKCYAFKDDVRYKCCDCKKIFTAVTNTFMSGTKMPLVNWIEAMWYLLRKKGISSVQLAKDLHVTQKTAWYMLHKLRTAMGNEEVEQLKGVVEIDEAFAGGKARFKHKKNRIKYNPGRGWADKTPILGMLERGGKVKAMVVPDVLMVTLKKKIVEHVRPGSDIMGDGFNGYRALHQLYNVQCIDHSKGWYVDGEVHTNTIEGFWSQFKKGIYGTYHQVTRRHLNKYVQEFVFKYNYRNLDMQQQIDRILCNSRIKITQKQMTAKAA